MAKRKAFTPTNMSLSIYPVFNPAASETEFEGLGEILALEFGTLDELAEEYSLTSLTAFADTREVPEDFDGPPEDLEELLGPWEDWFACPDGQAAAEALAELIADDPDIAGRLKTPEAVIQELRSLAQALETAGIKGARFRLELS
jgi:hypothetical protein